METESTIIEFSQKVIKLIPGLQSVESKTGISLYVISETMRLMETEPEFISEFTTANMSKGLADSILSIIPSSHFQAESLQAQSFPPWESFGHRQPTGDKAELRSY